MDKQSCIRHNGEIQIVFICRMDDRNRQMLANTIFPNGNFFNYSYALFASYLYFLRFIFQQDYFKMNS